MRSLGNGSHQHCPTTVADQSHSQTCESGAFQKLSERNLRLHLRDQDGPAIRLPCPAEDHPVQESGASLAAADPTDEPSAFAVGHGAGYPSGRGIPSAKIANCKSRRHGKEESPEGMTDFLKMLDALGPANYRRDSENSGFDPRSFRAASSEGACLMSRAIKGSLTWANASYQN